MSIINKIKRIEQEFYPPFMQQLNDASCIEDIADYAECSVDELIIVIGENCYFIASSDEIIDIAGDVNIAFIREIKRRLPKGNYEVDCRDRTYRFLQATYNTQLIEEWDWEGETMYNCIVSI
jgi:hypothetical protein